MDSAKVLTYDYKRRFGVEIEVNSLDRRDFIADPLRKGKLPEGINYIGEIITKNLHTPVILHPWHYTNNNNNWIVKPDRSCGLEICSPVSKGKYGLSQICRVVEVINADPMVSIDDRCSFHVHVNVSDCDPADIAAILAWWVKCEAVFIDSLPEARKRTRYCQCIGASDLFYHDFREFSYMRGALGQHKYFTVNTFHLNKGERQTIEFRILGHDGCKDANIAKNWIRLLIHFVEIAKRKSLPKPYRNDGNPFRGLCWLDPKDVLRFLDFLDYDLSEDMVEIRNWFVKRLQKNITTNLLGLWSPVSRAKATQEINELASMLNI